MGLTWTQSFDLDIKLISSESHESKILVWSWNESGFQTDFER